ncbi:MAG: hypothetical protein CMB99_16180 [Flavobacteriaceae bacterium]|nr:hypothetical protein [Flavobacteriaceae bacterium]|tara:strand:- start:21269 stop:22363 length:1095 start_codon:yes stop_codon:yes gene_type:complete
MASNLTIYSADDAGLTWPPESTQTGITNDGQRGYYGLYEILKACLVDGYTGKAGAGWSFVYDEIAAGTGYRYALTNQAQTGVMCIEPKSLSYWDPIVKVCDSALSPDDLVNDWGGDRSVAHGSAGTVDHFMTLPHSSINWNKSDTRFLKFILLATENSFYLHCYPTAYGQTLNSANSTSYHCSFYCGAAFFSDALFSGENPALGNFIVCGGNRSNSAYSGASSAMYQYGQSHSMATTFLRHFNGSMRTNSPYGVSYLWHFIKSSSEMPYKYAEDLEGIDFSALIPATLIEKTSSSGTRGNPLCVLPVFLDMFHPSGNALGKLLPGADFKAPVMLPDGLEYMALFVDEAYNTTVNFVPIAASRWP